MTDTIRTPKRSNSGRLSGKAAIITGAARGIGRATAVAFAREGADVMGMDIAGPVSRTLEVVPATGDELTETGRLVKTAGVRWCEARLDQRNLAVLRDAAEQARASFGRLDILFANAGIQAFKPILELEDADWQDTIDVNLTGTCNAIRAVAPHLVRNGGGRIIVTSSTQGRHGTKYGAAYSASKWGIIGLMKSAALELGEHKITVNAVIPGLIDTPLTRHHDRYAQAADDFASKLPTAELEAEAKKKLIAKSPLGVPWMWPVLSARSWDWRICTSLIWTPSPVRPRLGGLMRKSRRSTVDYGSMPALANRMSSRPKVARACSAASRSAARLR